MLVVINRCLHFLYRHLIVVRFVLLVPAMWLVRETIFCVSQAIGWEDHLRNYLFYVEWDIEPYQTIQYHTISSLLLRVVLSC